MCRVSSSGCYDHLNLGLHILIVMSGENIQALCISSLQQPVPCLLRDLGPLIALSCRVPLLCRSSIFPVGVGPEYAVRKGWEIKPATAAEYWADVPLDVRGRMHYFNVPCDTTPDSPFNPLNIVRNMYQPGDFVVIKLDIDNEAIEQVTKL